MRLGQIPLQYRKAEELEAFLGSPIIDDQVFSFKRSIEWDEAEQYPEQACEALNEWGLHLHYIPRLHGGLLQSFDELMAIMKTVARRDLTVAIAHGKTFLGAVSSWVGGSEDQQRRLALIIKRRGKLSLGLTERRHGSDLMANEARAEEVQDHYSLSGEKWLISNATRGAAITVLARTNADGGPRGYSLFLVEKDQLEKSSFSVLQKVKTLGIVGADISGIRFKDCLVPRRALIGRLGAGLEILLKGFQLTRVLIPALSLGAADTALRITLSFALSRRLYGKSLFDIPHARSVLVDAFLDLLICDCVATGAARALHVAPDQVSLLSALAKYLVPTTTQAAVHNLSLILGARHYLREGHGSGVFQKILRDIAILGIFDGSTAVNLDAISLQLRSLAEGRMKNKEGEREEIEKRLRQVFALDEELEEFDVSRLSLHNRGRDDVVQGLETAIDEMRRLQDMDAVGGGVIESLLESAGSLIRHLKVQDELLTAGKSDGRPWASQSPEAFEMASRYSRIHAGAACLQMWLRNRERLDEFFGGGEWVAMSLERILKSFEPERALERRIPASYEERVAEEMARRYRENHLFSLVPLRLANSHFDEELS